jgi:hypothetical protein
MSIPGNKIAGYAAVRWPGLKQLMTPYLQLDMRSVKLPDDRFNALKERPKSD